MTATAAATIPTTTTPTTTTAIHYRLSIEVTDHVSDEAERVTLVDLIATDSATGRRWFYVGPAPCGTQGEALDLIARIFSFERRNDVTFDPTARPEYWVREAAPVGDGWPMGGVGGVGVPETACTPSVFAKALANVYEVVEVVEVAEVSPAIEASPAIATVDAISPTPSRKTRARRVDAGKARRARAKGAGGAVAG